MADWFTETLAKVTEQSPVPEQPPAAPDSPPARTEAYPGFLRGGTVASRIVEGAGLGVARAGLETKDFFAGEPEPGTESTFRRAVEGRTAEMREESLAGSLSQTIAQFAAGMAGAGKVTWFLKGTTMAGRGALSIGRAAAGGAVAFDPHEERLSNLIQAFPSLQNPVTEYLAADPSDSAAEGRFKTAMESIGMDIVLIPPLVLTAKAYRALRGGKTTDAAADAEEALSTIEEAMSRDFADGLRETPSAPDAPRGEPAGTAAASPPQEVPAGASSLYRGKLTPEQVRAARALNEKNLADIDNTLADPVENARDPEKVKHLSAQASSLREEVGRQNAFLSSLADVTRVTDATGDTALARSATLAEGRTFQTTLDELTDAQIDKALDASLTDFSAVIRHGTREAAGSAGHRFTSDSLLPLNKIGDPGSETALFTQRIAETLEPGIADLKGGAVLTDKRVSETVSQLARLMNEDPQVFFGRISQAGQSARAMVANMEAAYLVANRALDDAYKLSHQMKAGSAPQGASELRRKMLLIATQTLGEARAMTAAAGRTVRRHRQEFAISPAQLDALRRFDDETLTDAILSTGGSPGSMAKLTRPGFWSRATDWAQHLLINGPLWWWPTQVVNLTGNSVMLAIRPGTRLVGSQFMRGADARAIRAQSLREWRYSVSAVGDGLDAAMRAFLAADSALAPHSTPFFTTSGENIGRGAGSGAAGGPALGDLTTLDGIVKAAISAQGLRAATGLPTRFLGAVDEMFKTIRYRAVVQARAAGEADARGLSRADAVELIQQRLEEAFDDSGRALDPYALREAQIATFNQPFKETEAATQGYAEKLGTWLQQGAANHLPVRLVFRYVRTPIQVLRYGGKLTPALNLLSKEYRANLKGVNGPEGRASAIGEMAMGSLFMLSGMQLAASGRITGSGPTDPAARKEWIAEGHRPYSIEWTDEETGEIKALPYGRFDPVGLPFGIAADLYDIHAHPLRHEDKDAIMAMFLAFANNTKDKAYMVSMHQAIQAMNDPERSLGKYLGQQAAGALPFSALLRGANPDPYFRDARNFVDAFKANIPGFSETVRAQRDALGRPAVAQRGLVTSRTSDPVYAELDRIAQETGMTIAPPAATVHGVDLRDLTLEGGRDAYDRFQELAADPPGAPYGLHEAVRRLIRRAEYQKAPEGSASERGTKLNMIVQAVSNYRRLAKGALRVESAVYRRATSERKRAIADHYRGGTNPEPARSGSLAEMLAPFVEAGR